MKRKNVDIALLLDAGNPVLDAREGTALAAALSRMESIHLGLYEDETSQAWPLAPARGPSPGIMGN